MNGETETDKIRGTYMVSGRGTRLRWTLPSTSSHALLNFADSCKKWFISILSHTRIAVSSLCTVYTLSYLTAALVSGRG